jgi:hypothetical protein
VQPGLLDGVLMCGEHNCPMIRIGDDYRCVIGYTDSMLGGETLDDFIPGSGDEQPITLVFSNGHTLPLLCPCCGGPYQFKSKKASDKFLKTLTRQRLRLHALAYIPVREDVPHGGLELVFVPGDSPAAGLADGGDLPEGSQLLQVHLDSVRGIA